MDNVETAVPNIFFIFIFIFNFQFLKPKKKKGVGKNEKVVMVKVELPGKLISILTGFAHCIARIYLENERREAFFSWGYGNE